MTVSIVHGLSLRIAHLRLAGNKAFLTIYMCRLCLARLLCCLLSCLAGLPLQHVQFYQVCLQHLHAKPCVSCLISYPFHRLTLLIRSPSTCGSALQAAGGAHGRRCPISAQTMTAARLGMPCCER